MGSSLLARDEMPLRLHLSVTFLELYIDYPFLPAALLGFVSSFVLHNCHNVPYHLFAVHIVVKPDTRESQQFTNLRLVSGGNTRGHDRIESSSRSFFVDNVTCRRRSDASV